MDRSDILDEDIQAFRNCKIDPVVVLAIEEGVSLDLTNPDVIIYFTIRNADDVIALEKSLAESGITVLTPVSYQIHITEGDWTKLPPGTNYRWDSKVISASAGVADIAVGGVFDVLETQSLKMGP